MGLKTLTKQRWETEWGETFASLAEVRAQSENCHNPYTMRPRASRGDN